MTILQNIIALVNKKGFDWHRNDITLQNFHPQMELFFAINGIFFNNRESKKRFIWPVLSSLLTLSATGLEIMYTWRGLTIKDYALATESFTYLIILGAVSLMYYCMLSNRMKIFSLLDDMGKDFGFICKLGPNYRKCFLDGQLLIWKLGSYWLIFSVVVAIIFLLNTFLLLLNQSLFATVDEHTVRPLLFPAWFPHDDPYRSPNYEILTIYHIMLIVVLFFSFILYVCILMHFLMHYYNLMDIILIGIDELFIDLDESVAGLPSEDPRRKAAKAELSSRIGRIVRWHNSVFDSVDTVTSVYAPMLVYQVCLSSVIICLMAYQVADQLGEGKLNYIFAILTFGATLQLWIPCYIGTLLQTKALSIGDRCFYCDWYTTPLTQLVRQDLFIFIMRAQNPVTIKFTCLPGLDLETFSSIMSSAYSYFNMLRQYN